MLLENNISTSFRHSPIGLYLHVPFCATTCDFCAFVQSKPNRESIKTYLDTVEFEWKSKEPLTNKKISTVFWGGGTPGLLLARDLQRLGDTFTSSPKFQSVKEWTVEMAPATVTPSKLKALKEIGVTRISMGVQTFSDKTLEIMGRQHTTNQVMRAWQWIKDADFRSVNIDMIIAYPGQNENELLEDLQHAIDLQPDHLSTYCLTFEEDTPLYAKLMQGIYKIDLDNEADLYKATWGFLENNGYSQYEISNFAKKGHQSLHNLNTWNMHEWIGIGPSASSQFLGARQTNSYDFEKWKESTIADSPKLEENTPLQPDLLIADALIFGLRTNKGVDFDSILKRFPNHTLEPWQPLFNRLVDENLGIQTNNSFRLTLEGRLKADAVGVEVLECQ